MNEEQEEQTEQTVDEHSEGETVQEELNETEEEENEEPADPIESVEGEEGFSLEKEGISVISDVGRTEETVFRTEKGNIHVIHEITLGDVVTSMLLATILIVFFLDRVIRR